MAYGQEGPRYGTLEWVQAQQAAQQAQQAAAPPRYGTLEWVQEQERKRQELDAFVASQQVPPGGEVAPEPQEPNLLDKVKGFFTGPVRGGIPESVADPGLTQGPAAQAGFEGFQDAPLAIPGLAEGGLDPEQMPKLPMGTVEPTGALGYGDPLAAAKRGIVSDQFIQPADTPAPEASIGPSQFSPAAQESLMQAEGAQRMRQREAVQAFRDQIPIRQQADIIRTGIHNAPGVIGALSRFIPDSWTEELLESGAVELTPGEKGLELGATFAPLVGEILLFKKFSRAYAGKKNVPEPVRKFLEVAGKRHGEGDRGLAAAVNVAESVPTELAIAAEDRSPSMTGTGLAASVLAGLAFPGLKAAKKGFSQVGADEFTAAVQRASEAQKGGQKAGEYLSDYSAREYGKMRTFLSEDGLTGFAIKDDGDLVSVFNVGERGRGGAAVEHALEEGAQKLDAFDGHLPEFYKKHGFDEVRREPNYVEGGPDVVFMERRQAPTQREAVFQMGDGTMVGAGRGAKTHLELANMLDDAEQKLLEDADDVRRVFAGGDEPVRPGRGPVEIPIEDTGDLRKAERRTADVPVEVERRQGPRRTADRPQAEPGRRTAEDRAKKVDKQLEDRRRARTDELTGVGNRSSYEKAKPHIDARGDMEWHSFDIRDFKALNEQKGHAAGDEFLKAVAAEFRKGGAEARDIFRIGGDEFMVATNVKKSEVFLEHMNNVKSGRLKGGFQPRLRSGSGRTADEAVSAMEAAQKGETGPKFRDATGRPRLTVEDGGLGKSNSLDNADELDIHEYSRRQNEAMLEARRAYFAQKEMAENAAAESVQRPVKVTPAQRRVLGLVGVKRAEIDDISAVDALSMRRRIHANAAKAGLSNKDMEVLQRIDERLRLHHEAEGWKSPVGETLDVPKKNAPRPPRPAAEKAPEIKAPEPAPAKKAPKPPEGHSEEEKVRSARRAREARNKKLDADKEVIEQEAAAREAKRKAAREKLEADGVRVAQTKEEIGRALDEFFGGGSYKAPDEIKDIVKRLDNELGRQSQIDEAVKLIKGGDSVDVAIRKVKEGIAPPKARKKNTRKAAEDPQGDLWEETKDAIEDGLNTLGKKAGVGGIAGGVKGFLQGGKDEEGNPQGIGSYTSRIIGSMVLGALAGKALIHGARFAGDRSRLFQKFFTAGGEIPGFLRRFGEAQAHDAARMITRAQGIIGAAKGEADRLAVAMRKTRSSRPRPMIVEDTAKGPFVDYTKAEQEAMNKWLHGRWDAPMDDVPEEARDVLRRMRRNIDELSRRLSKEDFIGDELQIKIKNNDSYVVRSFMKFDFPHWADDAPKILGTAEWEKRKVAFFRWLRETIEPINLQASKANAARQWHGLSEAKFAKKMDELFPNAYPGRSAKTRRRAWKGWQTRGKNLKNDIEVIDLGDENMEKILRQYMELPDNDNALKSIKSGRLGRVHRSLLAGKNENLPTPVRGIFGEYDDPWINYVRTVQKQSELLANLRLFEDLRSNGLASGVVSKTAGKNMVEIPKNNPNYGTLQGHWIDKDLKLAIDEHFKSAEGNWLHDGAVWLNAASKEMLTVGNLGTQVRNFFGNIGQLWASGVGPYRLVKYSKSSLEDLLQGAGYMGSADSKRKALIRLQELGIVGDGARQSELDQILKRAGGRKTGQFEKALQQESALNPFAESLKKFGETGTGRVLKSAFRPVIATRNLARTAYRFGDDYFKIIAFNSHLDDLVRETGKARHSADLMEQAARRTTDRMATFSQTPQAIRALSRFGAFPAFASEMVRTTRNTLVFIEEGFYHANPEIRKTARKALVGVVAAMFAGQAIATASRYKTGVSRRQDAATRTLGPEWNENSTLMYVEGVKDGKATFIDLSYVFPHGFMSDGLNAIMRGEPLEPTMKNIAESIWSPFLSVAPMASNLIKANKKDTPPSQQGIGAMARGFVPGLKDQNPYTKAIRESLTPGTAEAVVRLMTKRSRSLRELERDRELLGFAGLSKPVTIDAAEALGFKVNDYQNDRNAERMELRRSGWVGTTGRGPTKETKKELEERTARNLAEVDARMAEVIRAAIEYELPVYKIRAILKKGGVNQADRNRLMRLAGY